MREASRLLGLLSFAVLLALPLAARADERGDVLAANAAFEAAISARDVALLEKIAVQDAAVTLISPSSKTPNTGWEDVRRAWTDGTFARFSELSVSMANPSLRILGDTATVVGIEIVRGKRASDGGAVEFSALTTNTFERRAGRWLLVHHHASRAAQ